MPLQTILAVLTGDDADRSVLDAAIALTSPEPIAITALHVKADPQTTLPLFREGLSSAMIGEVVASMERETTARARKARAVFDTWCGEAKITARASDSGSALTSSAATWRELVGQEDDEVALVAIFDGIELESRSTAFRGGSLFSWFGGIAVDLRSATLAPEAHLTANALWGGIAIKVPPGWRIESNARALAGGVAVEPSRTEDPDAPLLVIDGFAVLGGIAVGSKAADVAPVST